MKPLIFAILLASSSAWAQNAAPLEIPNVALLRPNGSDTLKRAGEKLVATVDNSPILRDDSSPEERKRALELNAPALELMRQALKQDVVLPPLRLDDEAVNLSSRWQELGVQTLNESRVKLAASDVRGAGEAAADAIELGVVVARGVSTSALFTGRAIEINARKQLETLAPKLDAADSRALAARLGFVDARRASFFDAMSEEKQLLVDFQKQALEPGKRDEKPLAEPLKTPGTREFYKEQFGYNDAELELLANLSGEAMVQSQARALNEAIEHTKMPFSRAPFKPSARPDDPMWRLHGAETSRFYPHGLHFAFERNLTEHRLLQSALLLRAQKLESGAYPTKFEAPIDPFSSTKAPLVYKRDGDEFLLYSVGPDGKDDDGGEIQTLQIDPQTGAKIVSEVVMFDSLGDILAPIF